MLNQPIRIAINGFGRIGRCVLRAIYEQRLTHRIQVVHINEPANIETIAHLTRFDSTHGVFPGNVDFDEQRLYINGHPITVSHSTDPDEVDWGALKLDMLLECSGAFAEREQLERFIKNGCPRLLLSNPGSGAAEVDYTVVLGVNDQGLNGNQKIVSNASCTTNAIVPILLALNQAYSIEAAYLTTLHSVMNDQPMIDGYHNSDLRRTRSALQSMIPVSTGLARGVERLLPELQGKVTAKAVRVPILNVSAIDLITQLKEKPSRDEINAMFKSAAQQKPHLLAYSEKPHASIDFNHDAHSCIVDGSQTQAKRSGLVNVFVWFDNEWAFANRMLDICQIWARQFIK
ncbi:MAG TPA: glyceraldehyde 3-phosphate dehydrogenase NAD-binding domain-containing protein [Paenalcaligenes sp.]|nr:glyceraldehyde 3-phosphate dehydrogenase NAD-binding domain-containing protein [Paenalcaligenes sp.]